MEDEPGLAQKRGASQSPHPPLSSDAALWPGATSCVSQARAKGTNRRSRSGKAARSHPEGISPGGRLSSARRPRSLTPR